ncbi:MBL fold metallo-hydrolase [Sphingomonas morindae]|uniref:MBL fold metallo-hydrolase n=1 Tax=Sphingomonas morindae TaxID=1541170 RepID=A0ABY4X9P9_9SPHN|nr:MBL fold metallo-hydrolase [Sphingomonas morindae]USI73681.1 MBL fold metallo-hydrolase [Sphingomonas morindae]
MAAPVATVHPLVRRITAANGGPFTATGTQTHIVGHGRVAVIDPGPALDAHIEALLAAVAGETVAAILCTHTHRDHSPGAAPLAAATGAPVLGCAPVAGAGFDESYAPARVLADGEAVTGPGWTLRALATPGHTSNHLCFLLPEARALFSGDHVMGWSTSVVIPPDGHMGAYLASLERLLDLDVDTYFPAHGDPVAQPARLVRRMIGHRRQREGQILRLLGEGVAGVPEMVERLYVGLDPRLVRGAEASVLAHLQHLAERDRVRQDGPRWALAA